MPKKKKKEPPKSPDNRIFEIMQEKGISYRKLEQLSGVPYATICKIAKRKFSGSKVVTLNAIAYGLGVEIKDLFLPDREGDE